MQARTATNVFEVMDLTSDRNDVDKRDTQSFGWLREKLPWTRSGGTTLISSSTPTSSPRSSPLFPSVERLADSAPIPQVTRPLANGFESPRFSSTKASSTFPSTAQLHTYNYDNMFYQQHHQLHYQQHQHHQQLAAQSVLNLNPIFVNSNVNSMHKHGISDKRPTIRISDSDSYLAKSLPVSDEGGDQVLMFEEKTPSFKMYRYENPCDPAQHEFQHHYYQHHQQQHQQSKPKQYHKQSQEQTLVVVPHKTKITRSKNVINHYQPNQQEQQQQHQQHQQQQQPNGNFRDQLRLFQFEYSISTKIKTKENKLWQCPLPQCPRGYVRLSDLRSHFNFAHPHLLQEFPQFRVKGGYFCEICSANFSRKKVLLRHLKIEHNEKWKAEGGEEEGDKSEEKSEKKEEERTGEAREERDEERDEADKEGRGIKRKLESEAEIKPEKKRRTVSVDDENGDEKDDENGTEKRRGSVHEIHYNEEFYSQNGKEQIGGEKEVEKEVEKEQKSVVEAVVVQREDRHQQHQQHHSPQHQQQENTKFSLTYLLAN